MISRVTDLAVEVRESFPDDDVEISGVRIEKYDTEVSGITITVVDITDEHGAEVMGKPAGRYVTIEFSDREWEKEDEEGFEKVFADVIKKMLLQKVKENKKIKVLTAGLGNRHATPDMLGSKVISYIDIIPKKVCAIAPGVMAQTGMETCDIIKRLAADGDFNCIFVIDSLCSRQTKRLCHTVQITDTGISPGAGIGNMRGKINENVLGVPVIAIGVPTVVSMETVACDCVEETLIGQGFSQTETDAFLQGMSNEKYSGLFVTPKDIDEQILFIGKAIAGGLNRALNYACFPLST